MRKRKFEIQDGSNMTGTNCDLFTHKQSRSYLNHLVYAQTERPRFFRRLTSSILNEIIKK